RKSEGNRRNRAEIATGSPGIEKTLTTPLPQRIRSNTEMLDPGVATPLCVAVCFVWSNAPIPAISSFHHRADNNVLWRQRRKSGLPHFHCDLGPMVHAV